MTLPRDPTPARDLFSPVASTYAEFRPVYPTSLFSWLATLTPRRRVAWDVGTGTGQAAIALTQHFEHVVATDLSGDLLEQAPAHPRVIYRIGLAEDSGLPAGSVDLIAVAQALHWFDLARFYSEVRRVLAPDGVIAAWSYGGLQINGPQVNKVFQSFYNFTIASYWPSERRHVESGYRSLPFPFEEVRPPHLQIVERWPLDRLLGYCRTWSAVIRYRQAHNSDPVNSLEQELRPIWGDPDIRRTITWPISIRAGKIPPHDV